MNYNPVGWFEISVTDMARARAFYEKLLGVTLEVSEWPGGSMAVFPHTDVKGAGGCLVQGDGYVPSATGTLVYFTAPDLDGALAKVEGLGGKIVRPKTDIGEHGIMAFVSDTEGNRIALHTRKK